MVPDREPRSKIFTVGLSYWRISKETYRKQLKSPPLVDLGPPGGGGRKIPLKSCLSVKGGNRHSWGGWMCLSETRVLVSLSEVLVSLSEVGLRT